MDMVCVVKKLPTHVVGPFWTNWGVCQSGQIGLILTLITFYCTKLRFIGVIFYEKMQSHVIRAPCGRPFWANAWLLKFQISYQCLVKWLI